MSLQSRVHDVTRLGHRYDDVDVLGEDRWQPCWIVGVVEGGESVEVIEEDEERLAASLRLRTHSTQKFEEDTGKLAHRFQLQVTWQCDAVRVRDLLRERQHEVEHVTRVVSDSDEASHSNAIASEPMADLRMQTRHDARLAHPLLTMQHDWRVTFVCSVVQGH